MGGWGWGVGCEAWGPTVKEGSIFAQNYYEIFHSEIRIDLEVLVIFYEELPWRPFEKGNTGIFNTENFYDNCILSNRKQL